MFKRTGSTAARAVFGVALAAGLLWLAARVLAGVDDPGPVHAEVPAGVAVDGGVWRAAASPLDEVERLEVQLDGVVQERAVERATGEVAVAIDELEPGYHLIELLTRRRGGRVSSVINTVLVGPFATRYRTADAAAAAPRRCALSLQISPEALRRLLVPPVRERLLSAARETALLGPDTGLTQLELDLTRGGARFSVTLAGVNKVAVAGRLALSVDDARRVQAKLAALDRVEFTGPLRITATAGGAVVGGVAVGAAVSGPLAPLGAAIGYVAADQLLERRAQSEVRSHIEDALSRVSGVALVPGLGELIPGEPRSRVALSSCERPALAIDPELGVALTLAITPLVAEERVALASPGPVDHGARLSDLRPLRDALARRVDVQLELSIDTINALLDAWTASGLLGDLADDADAIGSANRALAEWTTLELQRLSPRLPPALGPLSRTGPEGQTDEPGAWSVTLGELELELTGFETTKGSPPSALVGGLGRVWPRFDDASGRLQLAARVERLWLTCERDGDARAAALEPRRRELVIETVVREPCFGALLEVTTFSDELDAALAPGAGALPALDVRGLVRGRTGLARPGGVELTELWIEHPEGAGGVLRIRGRLE